MERVGIADHETAKVLKSNSNLIEPRQRECINLTNKTFKILAKSNVRRQLETLHLAKSDEMAEGIESSKHFKIELMEVK